MSPTTATTAFGPFVLDPTRRVLLRSGEPVALTPKAFDILVALMNRAGTVVSKEDLLSTVWPDTVVDENNLAFQISTLRKALGEKQSGERYIATIPGQGYQLVAPLHTADEAEVVVQERDTLTVTTVEESASLRWAVATVAVLAIASGAFWFASRPAAPSPKPPIGTAIGSMAILPFKPIVAGQRDEALEMGMADSLIGRVASVHGIDVRPLSATRRYAGLEQDPIDAGRELRVDAVLDGTIHVAGDRMRVTARLFRVADQKQLWEGRFDDKVADLFAVQDSISRRLAAELDLRPSSQKRLLKRETENVDAYRAHALGLLHFHRLRRDEIDLAIGHYRRAIALDPRYAVAYAALAEAYSVLPISSDAPPAENFKLAREAAWKAVELDPELANGHSAVGGIHFWADWDWAQAEARYRRAIALDPGHPGTHMRYAHLLSNTGRHREAAIEAREAMRLDPLSRIVNALAGQFHLQAGNTDAAIVQLQHTLRIDPDFWIAHLNLGKAYEMQRRYDEALVELELARRGSGTNTEPLWVIGYVHGIRGREREARAILDELLAISRQRYVPGTKIALVHLGLGERDETFRWLRKACADRDVGLTFLRANHRWSQLRDDPRFAEIERCVGLPPLRE